jgi:flagellin FlaB
MKNRFNRFFKGLHRGQKGITGLETAIILIAFVTVASVLAYSVLSAGIFSSEKGKAAVYNGLDQASASMQIRGDVLAIEDGTTAGAVSQIQFTVASVLQDSQVDLSDNAAGAGGNSVVINFADGTMHGENVDWTSALQGAERGDAGAASIMDPNEAFLITVTVPATAAMETALTAPYCTFTIQVIPPKGAAITITRTLPGVISSVMNLH